MLGSIWGETKLVYILQLQHYEVIKKGMKAGADERRNSTEPESSSDDNPGKCTDYYHDHQIHF